MDERWKESQPLWQQWWYEADLDTKIATNQQDWWSSFGNLNTRNQKILQFNKVLRILNMVGGYQRKNRLSTIVSAIENGSEETADQLTKVMSWCMNQDDTYTKISDTFDGTNITGLNLIQAWMDFREDPENGRIVTSRIPFNGFLMDNYWTKSDLSDCDWIWTRRYLGRQQVLSLYPKIEGDLPSMNGGYGAKDGRFQFLAQNWYQYNQEMYAYDEYWTRDYRDVKRIVDKQTGDIEDFEGTRKQFEYIRRQNPNLELVETTKPTVKMHILVNNNLVYEEVAPYGIHKYPHVPFTTYMFPEVQNYAYRYQGVVRNLRDSQVELNRRRNRMMDVLDAQIQSGMIVKEDALVDPETAYKQGPGEVVFVKQTANIASDVVIVPPPQIPSSTFQLVEMLDKDIMTIAGATEELFGQAANGSDMSGFLTQLRMGAGLTSWQGIFDRLNDSQKALGNIFLDLIQANFGTAKVQKIIQDTPTQEFFDNEYLKYNCVVEEATMTTTQKQLEFVQALQLRQMGVPISNKYILEKSTLQGKVDIMQDIQQQEEQAARMQQLQTMQEIANQEVLTRSIEAKTQNDYSSARERDTRAISNLGLEKERTAMAEHDRALASLDHARAIKELDKIDDDRMLGLAKFLLDVENRQSKMDEVNSEQRVKSATRQIESSEEATKTEDQKNKEIMNMLEKAGFTKEMFGDNSQSQGDQQPIQ